MKIRRDCLNNLQAHLKQKEITLITGPRQVGKTTLMKELMLEVQRSGGKTLFLDLDFEPDKRHMESQTALIDRIRLEFGDQPGTLFIDEIQRKKDAGVFLKGIYDRDLPLKMVVSGSGSLELKENIHESLFGRKRVFEVMPVSFSELAGFRTDYRYDDRLDEYFRLEPAAYHSLIEEFLNYGGYPRVVLESTHAERMAQMNEIFTSYLYRDILVLIGQAHQDTFSRWLRFLAAHNGRMVDFSTMARETGITVATVRKYLWYAEKTGILKTITPWFANKVKEITKTPVHYFTDLGFRNFLTGEFGSASGKSDAGFQFQNMVFLQLHSMLNGTTSSIHFWRTTDGAEVDFVIDYRTSILPVEVKYTIQATPVITRSFRSFIDKYQPPEAWVVTPGSTGETRIGNCLVKFRPFITL
jgi:predicted AAA+ superfamily ATPase